MISETLLATARRRLVTIGDGARLTTAAGLFGNHETRLIVVCDAAGCMTGVVSRTDIVTRISRCTGCTCAETIGTAMTAPVTACRPTEAADEIWDRMKRTGFTHLPVMDAGGRPVGVLGARDVLETLLAEREQEESLLMDYVTGIGYR